MPVTWGLSTQGFKTKDLHTIKRELTESLQQNIDPSLSCGPDTVAGQIVAIIANQTRQVWEMGAGILASLDVNMAHGRSLEALCSLTGTYRRMAKRSQVKVLIRLAGGANLPKDSIAASSDNLNARFRTIKEISNNSPKEAVLEAEMIADEVGPVYVKANQLNHIITPHAGWLGITNPKDALLGRHDESDDALRLRRVDELRASGASTREALKANLKILNGVQAVHIEEGLHSFTAYVMGGDELEICQTL